LKIHAKIDVDCRLRIVLQKFIKGEDTMFKRIVVWDLDETIIDSAHRVPNHPDGTLNLEKYLEMKTYESVMRDTLLPLFRVYQSMNRAENYFVICTARQMGKADYDFLAMHSIHADAIFCRPSDGSLNHVKDAILKPRWIKRLMNLRQFKGLPIVMLDDAKPVISAMRKIGVVCLNSVKVNKRLT
jgi:phosphoglycolate phosphatase-like HAD superfamily hydrolase